MCGQLDQIGAVVDGLDINARGQHAVLPDVVHPFVDATNSFKRIPAVAHKHDTFDNIGIVILAHNAEARSRADTDIGHIAHAHGHALGRADGDVANVLHGPNEPDAANIEGLFT